MIVLKGQLHKGAARALDRVHQGAQVGDGRPVDGFDLGVDNVLDAQGRGAGQHLTQKHHLLPRRLRVAVQQGVQQLDGRLEVVLAAVLRPQKGDGGGGEDAAAKHKVGGGRARRVDGHQAVGAGQGGGQAQHGAVPQDAQGRGVAAVLLGDEEGERDALARAERDGAVVGDGDAVERQQDVAAAQHGGRGGGRLDAADEDAGRGAGDVGHAQPAAQGGGLQLLPLNADAGEAGVAAWRGEGEGGGGEALNNP